MEMVYVRLHSGSETWNGHLDCIFKDNKHSCEEGVMPAPGVKN